MMKMGLLFLACGLIACAHKNVSSRQPAVLEDMLQEKIVQPQDVLAWLKRCVKSCQSPDKEIALEISDGYTVLYKVAGTSTAYAELTVDQRAQAVLGQQKVRSGFLQILAVKENRDILETAYRELASPGGMYDGLDLEVDKAVHDAVDRLKSKPKTAATGWYMQGVSAPISSENFIPAIEAYRGCLQVDKTDTGCKSNYDELVLYYERPRCREPYFSDGISVLGSKSKEIKGFEDKTKWDQSEVFVAKDSILQSSDLLEASLEQSGQEHMEIWLSVKTFSVAKLTHFVAADLKSPPDKRADFFSWKFNGELISVTPVAVGVNDGQVHMMFKSNEAAKAAFSKICQKPTADRLPENLKL